MMAFQRHLFKLELHLNVYGRIDEQTSKIFVKTHLKIKISKDQFVLRHTAAGTKEFYKNARAI